jgi:hypothetical protein
VLHFRNCALVFLMAVASAISSAKVPAPVRITSVERLETFEEYEQARLRDDTPEQQRNRLIVAEYDRLFPFSDAAISSMSGDDLKAAFKAAYIAAFFAIDQQHVSEMKSYLNSLVRRNVAVDQDFVKMHDIFIAARMFPEANEIRAAHESLKMEKAPAILGDPNVVHKPHKLTLGIQADVLTYQSVDLSGKVLVVIAHPLCHFSVNAIKAISEQPALAEIFKGAVWLAPPGSRLNIPEVQRWNIDHPGAALAFMDKREDWSMFDAWATPTFYFLSNGKVIEKVEGWPPSTGIDGFYRAAVRWKSAR